MNADSIAGTVTAVLCVVVGLLIIGSALVPIVEHASVTETETEVTEEVTGYNTYYNSTMYLRLTGMTAVADGSTLTVDGETVAHTDQLTIRSPTVTNLIFIKTDNTVVLGTAYTGGSSDVTYSSATISFADGVLTTVASNGGSPSTYTLEVDYILMIGTVGTGVENIAAEDSEKYRLMTSPFKIGDGQMAMYSSSPFDVITIESTSIPDHVTMTLNDDNTATIAFTSGEWWGPYEWVGIETTTETTTTASEYAPLYAIIPIMLILSMAYVLIRRF